MNPLELARVFLVRENFASARQRLVLIAYVVAPLLLAVVQLLLARLGPSPQGFFLQPPAALLLAPLWAAVGAAHAISRARNEGSLAPLLAAPLGDVPLVSLTLFAVGAPILLGSMLGSGLGAVLAALAAGGEEPLRPGTGWTTAFVAFTPLATLASLLVGFAVAAYATSTTAARLSLAASAPLVVLLSGLATSPGLSLDALVGTSLALLALDAGLLFGLIAVFDRAALLERVD